MKKQLSKPEFPSGLKLEEYHAEPAPNSEQNLNQQDEEQANSDTEYTQSDETLDMAILQELIRDEEKSLELLIKDNDRAADYILIGDLANALNMLEKMEKLMEYIATNGKVLDRNIIIVCLYNLASVHQANWTLDKCAKYIEAVTYNLAQSIKHDELSHHQSRSKAPEDQRSYSSKAITLRKKQFLVKVYLQYCAVSSQLNRHDESLKVAQKAQRVMDSIIHESLQYCKHFNKDSEFENKFMHTPQKTSDRSRMTAASGVSVDLRKSLLNDITFRDEVYYNKQIVEYAGPFLEDFVKNSQEFSKGKMQEIINQTRNLLFNWKNNPENNEKYIRKELIKMKVPAKIKEDNRTLLGVQQEPEWLSTLNIGSIMHMRPLKYKDYAQKKEFINELTRTSLQEKAIFQSLTFFTLATEMRFIEMNTDIINDSNHENSDKIPSRERTNSPSSSRPSEAYHLKAIEIVCRYISGPCPYINHLITSYQKHYGQDLETIPEESLNSVSSSITGKELNRDDKINNYLSIHSPEQDLQGVIKLQAVNSNNEHKKSQKRLFASRQRGKVGTREGISDNHHHHHHFMTEEENYKEMRRDRKKDVYKSLNIRTKKLSNKLEELKKAYTNNLSVSSPVRNPKIETSTFSPKHYKKASRYETEGVEVLEERLLSKKNKNVPSLGLQKVLLNEMTTPQHVSGKPSINDMLGYKSERIAGDQNLEFLAQFNSSEPERRYKMGSPNNEMNVFLYKNFNKFIQNFYVKNDQAQKQKALETKIKEKYMNHPYQKELSQGKSKKLFVATKPSTIGPSSKINHPKTPTYIRPNNLSPMERAVIDEEFKRLEKKRPKTGTKRTLSEEAELYTSAAMGRQQTKPPEKYTRPFNMKDTDQLRGGYNYKK